MKATNRISPGFTNCNRHSRPSDSADEQSKAFEAYRRSETRGEFRRQLLLFMVAGMTGALCFLLLGRLFWFAPSLPHVVVESNPVEDASAAIKRYREGLEEGKKQANQELANKPAASEAQPATGERNSKAIMIVRHTPSFGVITYNAQTLSPDSSLRIEMFTSTSNPPQPKMAEATITRQPYPSYGGLMPVAFNQPAAVQQPVSAAMPRLPAPAATVTQETALPPAAVFDPSGIWFAETRQSPGRVTWEFDFMRVSTSGDLIGLSGTCDSKLLGIPGSRTFDGAISGTYDPSLGIITVTVLPTHVTGEGVRWCRSITTWQVVDRDTLRLIDMESEARVLGDVIAKRQPRKITASR